MFTRRFILCGLLALTVLPSIGCCGRLRNCVYRWRHCKGCCAPSFDAPPCCDAPAYGGTAYAGPVGPDPGCATCYAQPPAPAVPVAGGTQLHFPAPVGPPTVFQTSEPPKAMTPPGGK